MFHQNLGSTINDRTVISKEIKFDPIQAQETNLPTVVSIGSRVVPPYL
jgi:hypothetical protein